MSNKERAEEEKIKGNECMNSNNTTEAILHYTTAIKLDAKDHRLYSNRCYAFLQIQQHYLALQDAKTVIKLNPDWPKGYYRKGEVEYCTANYEEAIKSYEAGLALDSNNEGIIQAVSKSRHKLEELKKAQRWRPWLGGAFGIIIGLTIVIADHLVAEKPILKSIFLRFLVVAAFISLGLLGAWLYGYMLKLQCSSLLEPPADLGCGSCCSSNANGTSTKSNKREVKKATAKRKSTKT